MARNVQMNIGDGFYAEMFFVFLKSYSKNCILGIIPWFLKATPITRNDDPKLSIDVLKFFPQAGNDGTKVIWAHGTNTRSALEAAVKGH